MRSFRLVPSVIWALASSFGGSLAAHEPAGAPPDARQLPVVWPQAPRPAADAPNVIVVLWDDIGFGQFGCFGAPLATPTVDRLAAEGLRFTNFHAAPVCSPTRAALLTGRNPHRVGVACITEFANGHPNSRGGIHPEAGTVAAYLRTAGYSTLAVGKWHLTPMAELNPGADSTHWPTGQGFDHFFGFTSGETNPWMPELFLDRTRLPDPPAGPDGRPLHSEVALTDRAIGLIAAQRATTPDKPFFLYLAYSAGHAPHHPPPEYLARWRGRFDAGWDVAREQTLARQKHLQLVPPETTLPPRNPGVKAWAELPADERRLHARYYETFAAFVEHTDAQLGRLTDYLARAGLADNTLIIVASDNGASPEGGPEGMWNEVRLFTTGTADRASEGLAHLADLGSPLSYPTYPTGWTMAGSTPFRLTKGTAHEGGTRVPLIVRWPARIKDAGGVRDQWHHVTDVLPTVLAAARVAAPAELDGHRMLPLDGVDLAYTWDQPAAPTRHPTQYTEIYGHRAIQHHGWKAVTFHRPGTPYAEDRWELYDLAHDINERTDLAAQRPDKLAELRGVWEEAARANGVYPLDDRRGERELLLAPAAPARGRHFEFFPPVSGIHKGAAPDLRDRAWRLTADIPAAGPRAGVIFAFGGRFAGYALHVRADRLVFHHNYAGIERSILTSDTPVGMARRLGVSFTPDASGGAAVELLIDGQRAGGGRVPRVLRTISHETLDFGRDLYTPVSEDYGEPAGFTPGLDRVVIEAEAFPF